jgi:RND family efflux transporter MFP subunit
MTVDQQESQEVRRRPQHQSQPQGDPQGNPQPHDSGTNVHVPTDLPTITKRQLILIAIAVLLMFTTLFLIGFVPRFIHDRNLREEADAFAQQPPIVQVVPPQSTQQSIQLPLPGTTSAMQETALYARINGYLKQRYVDIGDHVKTGELLAEIDAPDVDAQLAQAKAALEMATANQTSSKTNYDLAQATLTRYKGLVASGSVTQQDLDTRQNNFNTADAAQQAAIASVKSAQANVQQLEAQQSFEKIAAPFDGVITVRNPDVGALISAANSTTNPMFVVSETDILRVFVNVPQSYASFIRINQPVTFTVPNYPGQIFTGIVARWAGALDPNTRTMLTELHFDNRQGLLWPGMYGEVKFSLHRDKPVFTVPTSALLFEANGTQLALIQDNKVHFQKITVGRDFGTEIEVLQGLQGNEQVVATPGEKLAEGITVQIADNNNAPGGASK